MIDLKLMYDLVRHLPNCRLIFMGDPFQLPPVEPGEVFAEWVEREQVYAYNAFQKKYLASILRVKEEMLATCLSGAQAQSEHSSMRVLCALQKTYRFKGLISRVAQCLRDNETLDLNAMLPVERGIELLSSQPDLLDQAEFGWIDLSAVMRHEHRAEFSSKLMNSLSHFERYFDLVLKSADVKVLDRERQRFQILCASYEGGLGVHRLNRLVEQRFMSGREFYHGKLIMITENQIDLGIFNGDIGIMVQTEGDALSDRQPGYTVTFCDKPGESRSVPFSLIRNWQSAYAISIHKSQGSEYQRVAIFVPDYARELVSRRLIYTAITRSRAEVELWISSEALAQLN